MFNKQMTAPKKLALAFILLSILILNLFLIYSLDTDFGKVKKTKINIEFNDGKLSGLLFQPTYNSETCPAVVIAHGISESAQIMSSLGLELSRNGFVALCLDLPGHGGSEGRIREDTNNPALGIIESVKYLSNQSFVDSSGIGLIGHSLGAGAVRAASSQINNIKATVLIGGSLGDVASGEGYGQLNATHPKNMLIIVGQYDVLFNITELTTKALLPLFDAAVPVEIDQIYGNFEIQTARKLVTPSTTHLFESLDSTVITQSIIWMKEALQDTQTSSQDVIYPIKEFAQVTALSTLLALILLAYFPFSTLLKFTYKTQNTITELSKKKWKTYLVWAILNLGLFFLMIPVGLAIGFPPLIFGSSIAWWLLAQALIGLLILQKTNLGVSINKSSPIKTIQNALTCKKEIVIASTLFLILYVTITVIETFNINIKMVAPILQTFTSIDRVLFFFVFLPFFILYFIVQYLFLLRENNSMKTRLPYLEYAFANVSPFMLLLAINFLPKIILDTWIIPNAIGFLIEFLWLMTPIFFITSICSFYFYRRTNDIALGAFFNTLLFAWISATVFPL